MEIREMRRYIWEVIVICGHMKKFWDLEELETIKGNIGSGGLIKKRVFFNEKGFWVGSTE